MVVAAYIDIPPSSSGNLAILFLRLIQSIKNVCGSFDDSLAFANCVTASMVSFFGGNHLTREIWSASQRRHQFLFSLSPIFPIVPFILHSLLQAFRRSLTEKLGPSFLLTSDNDNSWSGATIESLYHYHHRCNHQFHYYCHLQVSPLPDTLQMLDSFSEFLLLFWQLCFVATDLSCCHVLCVNRRQRLKPNSSTCWLDLLHVQQLSDPRSAPKLGRDMVVDSHVGCQNDSFVTIRRPRLRPVVLCPENILYSLFHSLLKTIHPYQMSLTWQVDGKLQKKPWVKPNKDTDITKKNP